MIGTHAMTVAAGDSDDTAGVMAFARAAAADFELLAVLHDREPTPEMIAAMRVCPIENQLGVRLESEPARSAIVALKAAVRDLPRVIDAETLDELASGYADVYFRHTYRAAPTESVWLTEDGLERQGPMFQIRDIYKRNGLRATDWAHRSDDHLVLQLRFLSHVLARAKSTADLATPAWFMDEHLLRWLKPFALRLISAGAHDLFAAIALLTAAYAHEIREHLAVITGIDVPAPKPLPSAVPSNAQDEAPERPYIPGATPSW